MKQLPAHRLAVVLFALILLSICVNGLTTNVVSEKHDITSHEIVFEITNTGVSNVSQDLNLDLFTPKNAVNIQWFQQETYSYDKTIYFSEESDCLNIRMVYDSNKDTNNSFNHCFAPLGLTPLYRCQSETECYANTYGSRVERVQSNRWVPIQTTKFLVNGFQRVATKNRLFEPSVVNTYRVVWETPVSSGRWGSSGSWSINPVGWWNDSWSHRKTVTVTNNSASDLNDYQILINVANEPQMQSQYQDIRFIDSDNNTDLNQFRENYSNGDANFWVQLSVDAGSSKNIYVYYGNASASLDSDTNTFAYFDHFDHNSGFTSDWNGDIVYWSVDASKLVIPNNNGNDISILWVVGPNITKSYAVDVNVLDGSAGQFYVTVNASTHCNDGSCGDRVAARQENTDYLGAFSGNDITYNGFGKYNVFSVSHSKGEEEIQINNAVSDEAFGTPKTGPYVSLGAMYTKGVWYADWVRVREFDANEPTYSFGSAEVPGGTLFVSVFDEVSNTGLSGASVSLYGKTFGTDASGYVSIDLNYLPEDDANRVFSVSKSGYGTRYFTQSLDANSAVTLNVLLLDDTNGNSFSFQYVDYPNKTIELFNHAKGWNKYATISETDGQGFFTVFLDITDLNYQFTLDSTNDFNVIDVNVLRPKDEETNAFIDDNYNVVVSGLGNQSDLNVAASSIMFKAYPNTWLDYYLVTVSSESSDPVYLNRKYEMSFPETSTLYTLQPYLVSSESGTTIKVVSQADNGVIVVPYANVNLKFFKNIGAGGTVLVEETVTDAKGEAFVSLMAGDTYEVEAYVEGVIKEFNDSNRPSIKITGDTIYFVFSTTDGTVIPLEPYGYKVTRTPFSQNLTKLYSGNQSFVVVWNSLGVEVVSLVSVIQQNDENFDVLTWEGAGNHTFTHSIAWSDMNVGIVRSVVYATFSDGNVYTYPYVWNVNRAFGGYYDPVEGLKSGLRKDFGCSATGVCVPLLIVALVFSAGFIFFISIKIGQLSGQSTSILFGILMSLFTYLTWVPLELTIVVWVAVFAFVINDRKAD